MALFTYLAKIHSAFRTHCAALTAIGLAALLTMASAHAEQTPAQSTSADPVSLDVLVNHPSVLKGSSDALYVMLKIHAPEIPPELRPERPPLNFSMVLDRSGSMEEKGKIEYLRQAAKFAVDRLQASDHLSIVEYDDQITVMLKGQPVTDKQKIKALIDTLHPRNSTNLAGGMMRGVDEVKDEMAKLERPDTLHRVLLISDGLANSGTTEPMQIKQLVKGAKADGVRISTMGLGRDYDENLMQMIAEHGGGSYYYIEHPNQIARIFERELQTLFTTIAKDPKLTIEINGAWDSIEWLSSDEADDKKSEDGKLILDLENIYAGEERTYLLRLQPKHGTFAKSNTVLPLGTINFSYLDTATGQTRTITRTTDITVVADQGAVQQAANKDVIVESNLVEAERAHIKAIETYEAGDYEGAAAQMRELEEKVNTVNATLDDDRLANKAEALRVEERQMETSAASPADQSMFLKSSKQRLYQTKQGKRALYNLKPGDKGYEVERLQNALKDKGYYNGPIDGVYSDEVKQAVEKVQQDNNLAVDGVAGPETQEKVANY